jgi:hypothetical protein
MCFLFSTIICNFQEFKAFADLWRKLEPFTMAIFSYGKVNGLLMKQDLKRAASHVKSSIPALMSF